MTRLASAAAYLAWDSSDASHRDWHYFPTIDFWRDDMPTELDQQLADIHEGDSATARLKPGEWLPRKQTRAVKQLQQGDVSHIFSRRHVPGPFIGRYYPKGLLADCNGIGTIFPQDMTPVRINDMNDSEIEVDFNHPLADYTVSIGLHVRQMLPSKEELGGQCNEIIADIAAHGCGLQSHPAELHPDFFTADSFKRIHEQEDSSFYVLPRLVQHIDSQARSLINKYYRRYIKPGMQVLDLMGSWESHVQGIDATVRVTGLGINDEELRANPALHAHDICDLNKLPALPYQDQSFDIVICTVSVEYLTCPVSVFREVARVLKPAGRFIITFSDRWFPEKVIRVWTELHPYERMGLVQEYFHRAGNFDQIATESWQGWLRPEDDKYFPNRIFSDPVFAVQGIRI